MQDLTEQQVFWKHTYSKEYIERNSKFDHHLGLKGWAKMLAKVDELGGGIKSILECGSNIGRNMSFLRDFYPDAKKSIIELSEDAFKVVTENFELENAQNCPILNAQHDANKFDLVFTTSVLIHIHPDHLLAHMQKMHEWSKRYILINEYFNRTPTMIEYRGEKDKLFKSDFGKTFIENFDVKLVDYGFLWGHEFDNGGFDDTTFWLFEKK